ncbi:hypothetical protein [Parapedobacter tibetensis]|uniref:hypothetical protein n=1 Tax=Parapedobacter tibetensis TaxID=2972951 RepID=UPI00214D55F1|nr:hypothetical protein [Parapedobacter tibetensis]
MKYQRAKAGFFRYADGKLVIAAARIIKALKESTVFTDPKPSLEEVEVAYADYQRKVVDAAGGGRIYSTAKRESKRRLADVLQELAFYVSVESDGSLAKLHSSGFPVLAKKRKGKSPDTPGLPFLKDGRMSGEVAFGFKPVGRDMLYDYCFASEVDKKGRPIWGELHTTSRSFTDYVAGFTRGDCVYFRVRARNKHGISHWTAPVMLVVR